MSDNFPNQDTLEIISAFMCYQFLGRSLHELLKRRNFSRNKLRKLEKLQNIRN